MGILIQVITWHFDALDADIGTHWVSLWSGGHRRFENLMMDGLSFAVVDATAAVERLWDAGLKTAWTPKLQTRDGTLVANKGWGW